MLTQCEVMGQKHALVRLLNPFLIPQQLRFYGICYVKEKLCPKSQKMSNVSWIEKMEPILFTLSCKLDGCGGGCVCWVGSSK